jgi:hypothetical protein
MTTTEQHVSTRHLNRSAFAYTTGTQTTIYQGFCAKHGVPVREDMLGLEPALAPPAAKILCFVDPDDEHEIDGQRLIAIQTTVECDGSCRSARRRGCSCGCGGINHGITWTRGFMLEHREVFETELAQLRASQEKTEKTRAVRRENTARQEREAFEDWMQSHATVVQALAPCHGDSGDEFLQDLAAQVFDRSKPLTQAQETAALRAIDQRNTRERRLAERAAAKRPAPLGTRIPVSGRVIKVKVREGYMSATEESIIVSCDGYAIQLKMPAAVRRWVYASRPEVFFGQKFSYEPDYSDLGERWTRAVKGMQISFTAGEIALGSKSTDNSFAYAKRATSVQFTPAPVDGETKEA